MARKLRSAFTFSASMATLNRGDEGSRRLIHDFAVAKRDPAVGTPSDVGLMGDEDHGDARLVQLLEYLDNLFRGVAVERAGRLVGEEDVRVVDERARNRYALLLAAR